MPSMLEIWKSTDERNKYHAKFVKNILRIQDGCFSAVVLMCVLFLSQQVALAQSANATIRGSVTDVSGAVMPKATVTVRNQDTNVVAYKGLTSDTGVFVVPQVPTGNYAVTVEAPGMKRTTLTNIVATISQTIELPITLQLGTVSEEVKVTTSNQELEHSTSNISTLISPSEVQDLPLQNRDVFNLLALVPGVSHGGSATALNSQAISFNGSRSLNTEMLLNGVSLVVPSTGYTSTLPAPDGITEMRVLTNNAPAEFGRTSGAVIAVNTRSGTSAFHGGVYSLVRNEALNANNYFFNLKNVARSRDRYYQFGGSIGGPVILPRLYGPQHNTFFFFNYDRTLQRVPNVETDTVPSAAYRSGDFSTSSVALIDPTTHKQFNGNIIPPNRIDPAAKLIMARLPLPNAPGTYDAINNRYTDNLVLRNTLSYDALRVIGRLDQQITQNDRVYVSIFHSDSSQPLQPTYNDPVLSTTYDCNCINAWTDSVGYTHIFSPSLVMDLNYGFFRNGAYRHPNGTQSNASSLFQIDSLPEDALPALTISGGYTGIGATTNTNQLNVTNTFIPFGSITKTWRSHTFKFGGLYRWDQFNSFNPATYVNGNMNFTGEITSSNASSSNPANALADFLLGKIKTASYEIPQPENGRRNFNLGVYAQDDYRITPKLTINAGVRYEYESPQVITTDQYSRFDLYTGTLLVAGKNATRSLNITTPKLNFSPRIGFAYSPLDKTVVRAAFGTFYGNVLSELGGQIAYPGYDVTQSFNNLGTGIAQSFSLVDGIPLTGMRDPNNPAAILTNATPSNPVTVSGVEFGKLSPLQMVQQWNLGIQQQILSGILFELNYVGSHALHLPIYVPFNLVPISEWDAVALANTTKTTQLAKPFPNIGTYSGVMDVGNASYNSLQASLRRQFSSNLAFITNYTWAKNIDDDSSIFGNGLPAQASAHAQYSGNAALRRADRSPSSFDVRNTFNLALQYTTGGPAWLRDIKISPIFIAHSGVALNITQNNLIPNVTQQRPNGDVSLLRLNKSYVGGTLVRYFKPPTDTTFPLTPTGPLFTGSGSSRQEVLSAALGDVGRNSVNAPGEMNLDLSLSRTFHVYREASFQLRVDAFNMLNHTNLGYPSLSLTATTSAAGVPIFNSSGFGAISSAQPARVMQLVSRFSF